MNTIDPLINPATHTKSREDIHTSQRTYGGYLLLAISLLLYAIEEYADIERLQENLAVFFVHYFIALLYTGILIFNRAFGIRKSWRKENIHRTIILLHLFLISAYALNRQLPVFENSVTWFCVYLLTCSGAALSYRYFSQLPRSVNRIQLFLLGSALVLYVYLALYAAEFYMIAGIGIIIFGIGAHILVPVFLLIGAGALIKHFGTNERSSVAWIISGVLATVFFAAGFVYEWNARIKNIERMANQSVLYADTELPVWVKVAQSVKTDWITERILKSKLVYTISNNTFRWDLFPSGAWDEKRKHDPLVFIASLNRKSSLPEDDHIKILKAITDSRHRSEERLWSGDNLTTSYIVTDADIYPALRLAYTEKYFNIRNSLNTNKTWRNTEEAIYTFQLPEGSVVTSLSLWINGKEEKAILTSKQKATEAYKTIVGVEARDPSVVHWQEGNTVSVRIFPCTPKEERKFKIGITSPLPVYEDKIHYKSITFKGPNANDATETFRIRFLGDAPGVEMPDHFEKNQKGEYVSEQAYDPDFGLSFNAGQLKKNQFSFDGFTYSLAPYQPEMRSIDFTTLHLDINNSWSSDEINDLRSYLTNRNIYTYADNEFIRLTENNWTEITTSLQQRNFSVFPFHHISKPEASLVITKGRALSPHLRDFKDSNFAKGVSDFFAAGKSVYVYNLAGSASTYVRSLKELRALEFAEGDISKLAMLLDRKQFPSAIENEQQIVVHDANMIIEKKPTNDSDGQDNAPDHLARLFAYNDIMRRVGSKFFSDDFIDEQLVNEAAKAYVVSPVSSLIVLETKQDYERFGIKDIENSLENASKQSSGAVPEPHEWALIILFVLFVIFTIGRQRHWKLNLSK
jgi:XrtN system VIT domain protein